MNLNHRDTCRKHLAMDSGLERIRTSRDNWRMRQLKAVRRVFLAGLITLVSLTFSAFAETQPFRFAFLSDVHVGSLTGQEDLRATVQDMNSVTGLSFVDAADGGP